MRLIARTDANQVEIVKALRDMGANVMILAQLGGGIPDLLCGYLGKTYLWECKVKGGGLTDDEAEFFANWRGGHAHVIHSAEEAVDIMLEDDEEEN